jgi:hypothetical protein
MIWPGSHVFCKDGQYFRIYIGDGLKYEPVAYYPSFNHTIPLDNEDPELMREYKCPDKIVPQDPVENLDQSADKNDED